MNTDKSNYLGGYVAVAAMAAISNDWSGVLLNKDLTPTRKAAIPAKKRSRKFKALSRKKNRR